MKTKLAKRKRVVSHLAMATAVAILFALPGCGGGGVEDVSTVGSAPAPTTPEPLTGTFVDAPTKGLSYTASPSGLSGTTDANGSYQYQPGDTVTFSIPNGATPILLGSATPVAPSGGGQAVTFVLNLTNGQQIAEVLQSVNHSTSTGMLDVSGLSLDSANTANLNTYIATGGQVLPTGVTNTTMLQTAQAAASFSGGGSATTPVTSTFLTTVATSIQDMLSNLAPSSTTSIGTALPGSLFFVQAVNGQLTPRYAALLKYHNPNGAFFQRGLTGMTLCGTASASYASGTYTATGDIVTDTYAPNTGSACPTYMATTTFGYFDGSNGAAKSVWQGGSIPTGGASYGLTTVVLDTSFNQASLAGKTVTFLNETYGGFCAVGHPFQIAFDADASNFTASCQNSSTVTPVPGTVAAVSTMPGVLALTNSAYTTYWGLVKGTTLQAVGRIAAVLPGPSGYGVIRDVTAAP